MTKEEYTKALKSIKWQNKRKAILKRDGHKCTRCSETKKLHVHHTYYLIGKMPWEVPDDCLITLCDKCHKKEHEDKDISSFVRKNPPRKRKNKQKSKKQKGYSTLSKKDNELQEKYNEIRRKGKLPKSTYEPLVYNNPKIPKRKKKKKR